MANLGAVVLGLDGVLLHLTVLGRVVGHLGASGSDDLADAVALLIADNVALDGVVVDEKLESLRSEVEATALVGAEHEERSGGRSLLRVSRDVEASATDAVRAVVEEGGDLSRVAVVVDNNGRVRREERVEAGLGEGVRVGAVRSEDE